MKTVMLRNVEIGKGAPKLIVPIVGKTQDEIISKGKELLNMPMQVVEWRADFYEDVFDIPKVIDTLEKLNTVLGNIPILFTFRTKREGGEKEIDMDAYTALNIAVAQSGNADALDVEIVSGDEVVKTLIAAIHQAGKVVVASNHDFQKTPPCSDIVYRLRKMQDLGADILKIAVMPQNKTDVLTLISATEEMYRLYADRPLITMSMSPLGVITRLCGETFGSSMTFGAVGQTSAPGQIPVEKLDFVIDTIHNAI